jgi:cell filamentation protein
MNLAAFKLGYKSIELYFREGDSRRLYISALREADKSNFGALKNLIENELIIF